MQPRSSRILVFVVLSVFALAAAGAALWRYTPLATIANPQHLAALFDQFERSAWSVPLVLAAFVLGGFVLFPLTLLITATGLVFDPLIALPLSLAGSLASAAAVYAIGSHFLKTRARNAFGARFERIERALSERGIIAIAVLRMLPIAPFSILNIAAGSVGVRFWDFLIGTVLGLAPGLIVLTFFAGQVRAIAQRPTLPSVLALVGIVVLWVLMSLGLQRLVSRSAAR
ncbi:MAG: VTT domain-containing protein [Gammaproteobacteria bacterium]